MISAGFEKQIEPLTSRTHPQITYRAGGGVFWIIRMYDWQGNTSSIDWLDHQSTSIQQSWRPQSLSSKQIFPWFDSGARFCLHFVHVGLLQFHEGRCIHDCQLPLGAGVNLSVCVCEPDCEWVCTGCHVRTWHPILECIPAHVSRIPSRTTATKRLLKI